MTIRLKNTHTDIAHAAQIIRSGGLVAVPTETVYGLGADATNGDAVARIYEAKGRPSFNPLIVHVADLAAAQVIAEFNEQALLLATAFWPGPLTLVLPERKSAKLSSLVTAGLQNVGVRVPAHPLANELLQACGCPLAAPSANLSNRISPVTADHVLGGLNGRIDAVLDGARSGVGVESTIVGFGPDPVLLRAGGIAVEAIEATLGQPLGVPNDLTISSPGQLASHYAPNARLRLNASAPQTHETWIGFGPDAHEWYGPTLSSSGDLREAAANLFDVLHQLDEGGVQYAAFAAVPEIGLGRAINDRLRRAAAPR